MHNDTEDIVNFSFLFPCLSWWNETLVQIVCQCNWGHTQKHQSSSSQFSSRSSNNMVLSARKRKVNVWASKHTSVAPLPCFQPLDCELKWFFSLFFLPSLKRWNRRCWMMDRCAGIVLFCSALKEIIDLHYSPTHKTQPSPHTFAPPPSTSYCSTPMTAPPPTWQPTPQLLIKEWMFISLPVFYRGRVLSPISGNTSPELTREGKLSRFCTGLPSLLKWFQNNMLPRSKSTLAFIKRWLLYGTWLYPLTHLAHI